MTRLGLLAYATDTGLGIQTRALYRNLHPAKTMLVDLNTFNHMPVHDDWYDYVIRTKGFPTDHEIERFLQGLDVIFVCETPLNYQLFRRARQLGVKIILQYNYEFLDYLSASERRFPALPLPDILAAPTSWNITHVRRLAGVTVERLSVPIEVDLLPQRTIEHARNFFHIAGRPAIHDRNGTLAFIAAVRVAKSRMPDASFTIYCQQPTPQITDQASRIGIELIGALDNNADMFRHSDVLVLPRRYGGLCLPAQEAVGCGIPVLITDIDPNNDWLPDTWRVPVTAQVNEFISRSPISVYSVNVPMLAQRMVDLYENDDRIHLMNDQAKLLASTMSWQALKPKYEEVLGLKKAVV